MIVKIGRSGTSFKGLTQYLMHDPKAETCERVAWTYTLNLANDHISSAVDEMYRTYSDAELLKDEAGVRRGGHALEKPVKHVSLNWHPDDAPTKSHMIETAESFLNHMGWHEYQAVIIAHNDKDYDHLHIELNSLHPETGLKLDEGLEKRRAKIWRLGYERSHEQTRCEQRFADAAERVETPTRAAWQTMKEAEQRYAEAEAARRKGSGAVDGLENDEIGGWRALKTLQREEREAFFDGGKAAYKSARDLAFREVRETFREEWHDYYAAKRDGLDDEALRELKTDLVSRQHEALVERRDQMSQDLREFRDSSYADLLSTQQADRASFSARTAMGEDASDVLADLRAARIENAGSQNDNDPLARLVTTVADRQSELGQEFRSAGVEVCTEATETKGFALCENGNEATRGETRAESARVRDGIDLGAALGAAAFGEALTFSERLFEGFLDDAPRPAPRSVERHPEPERQPDLFSAAADAARRRAAEEDEVRRNEWWDDRRSRARE